MSLTDLSIHDAKKLMVKQELLASDLLKEYKKKIETENPKLNAIITNTIQTAEKQIKLADKNIKDGEIGCVEGIPVCIKDLFCTKGIRTTAASKMLSDFIPGYESTVTENLFKNGGIMLGKTNMDEFAMGSRNIFSYFGAVKNPIDSSLSPGGSSGGSAAAVAAKMCVAALGSDTGGSVRQPAALCGVVGVKPSYGRCSRYGMISFASSLDQAGVISRNVRDASYVLESIWGYDNKDSTSIKSTPPTLSDLSSINPKNLKIGIPSNHSEYSIDKDVMNAWEKTIKYLKEEGATIIDVPMGITEKSLAVYYVIATAEAASNLARYDGIKYGHRAKADTLEELYIKTRSGGFLPEVKRRIMLGNYVLSSGYYDAYYVQAQKIRRMIVNQFNEIFKKVDIIVIPTTPSAALPAEEAWDPVKEYTNDILTVPASIAGLPAISIPSFKNNRGIKPGIQVIAPYMDEITMFSSALLLEQIFNNKT